VPSTLSTAILLPRLTIPIAALRQKAVALPAEPAPLMALAGPPEIRDLWLALQRSAAGRDRRDGALRDSEERFRGIFENASTGIAITDTDGRFLSSNPAFSTMLGYSEEELRALTCPTLMHPDDRRTNLLERQRLLAQEIQSFEIVNRSVRKDGKPIWVDKHVSLLQDAAGRPTTILALITDVTEKKHQDDQIRLIMREVNHRSKNLLTVVQAVARQTAAVNPEDFLERFGKRVEALAASKLRDRPGP
jgi:PAS domain S-box-containing protein